MKDWRRRGARERGERGEARGGGDRLKEGGEERRGEGSAGEYRL